ncbi:MAG: energy coupling factor transporter S component ThiW [Spirochaetales bacterium]|nr:energy coupling factor transporter S component ThiW [Spirochaetales bacterium]
MSPVKKTAYTIVFMALAIALSPFTSIPVGIARINPTQHFVNVFLAVLVGARWNLGAAAGVSLIRNALGVGSLLAFPGSMIGAFLGALGYRMVKRPWAAALGEVLGTGILAPFAGAWIIAPALMGKHIGVLALLPGFLLSSLAGSFLALTVITSLEKARVLNTESLLQD